MLLIEGIFTKSKVVKKNKKRSDFLKKKKLARDKVSGIILTKYALLPDQKKFGLIDSELQNSQLPCQNARFAVVVSISKYSSVNLIFFFLEKKKSNTFIIPARSRPRCHPYHGQGPSSVLHIISPEANIYCTYSM